MITSSPSVGDQNQITAFGKERKVFSTYFWLNPAPRVESQLPGFVFTGLSSEFLPQFLCFLLSDADQT